MQYPRRDSMLTRRPSYDALRFRYQEQRAIYVPAPMTRWQKVGEFFLGLGLGLTGVPCLFALVSILGNLLGSSGLLLSSGVLLLPPLTGAYLIFSKSQRLLGLGILIACFLWLMVLVVVFLFIFLLIQSAFQSCPYWPMCK